ncbi:Putative AGC/YANK protein kinase [Rhizopus microsporus]|nr:Putative AGC/YANK protein kinase [Rhizopus microsporus]
MSRFKIIKTIGQGGFCKVYKVQHAQRKRLYALKVINKEKCIKMGAVFNVIRERKILENLDHPLICNMRFAFQDTSSIYMAMDLMIAGDLRFHITHKQHNEQVIRFWISELVCAVKYLHSQGIVHRDIKPDNILLDKEGHIHLSDFNIACEIPSNKPLISLSGTAAYFAPEMLKGNGYDEDVDWWSVGITFYECVYGKRPWSNCNNIEELKKQVVYNPIPYPPSNVSLNCLSALKSFLEKDAKKRLGHGVSSGWRSIMSHPFFKPVDWYSIDTKQSLPLYIPEHKDEETVNPVITNTDLQPPDGVAGWLYRCQRRASYGQLQQDRRYSQDLKLLEERFKTFDYTVFDEYEGFLDEKLMTVGPPPPWVKPAFPGADNGSLLPVHKIYLENLPSVYDVFANEHHKIMHHPTWPAVEQCYK